MHEIICPWIQYMNLLHFLFKEEVALKVFIWERKNKDISVKTHTFARPLLCLCLCLCLCLLVWIFPIFQSFQFDFFLIFLIFYWYSINRLDFVNNGKNQVVINLICCIPPSQLFTDIKPISLSSSANHDKQMHWMLPLKVILCYDFLFRMSIFRQTSGLFSENGLFWGFF